MIGPIRNTTVDDCWAAFVAARRDCILAWEEDGRTWERMAVWLGISPDHVRTIWSSEQPRTRSKK